MLAVLVAIFSTVLPSFLINAALGRIGAPAVAALGLLGPVSTIAAAILILNEPFGLVDAGGTTLVIIGIGLYTLLDQRQKKRQAVILPPAGAPEPLKAARSHEPKQS